VLLNFAGNAVKFTERGFIVIHARQVEAQADEAQADHVVARFEVRDTGVGIAPECRERIFQTFEQADNSSTRRYGGAGMGLAISQRLAQMMGGKVGVDSQPGVGSVFWLRVPLGQSRHIAPSPLSPLTEREGTERLRPATSAGQPIDETQLRKAVAELEDLLTKDDMRANQFFREVAPLLYAGFGDNAELLERQINLFEYNQALETLHAAVAKRANGHQ
jgi:hypothetical protein